ncbi:MAG: substrate-binding domain-containing protein, partial [Bacteroidota bacterium]
IRPDRDLELAGDFTEASGFDAARRIIAMQSHPTAVFASNDSMAIGAIGAFHEHGIRIPQQISVCGFDDIPVARYLQPALTSVHVPIHDLGFMSIEMILKRLQPGKRKEKASQILVATTLSVRASCGPITEGSASSDDEHLKARDRQGSILKRSEA